MGKALSQESPFYKIEKHSTSRKIKRPPWTELDCLMGKLLYEESYLLYLQGDYLAAARGFHKSDEMDFRWKLQSRQKKKFGMMSQLMESASLFHANEHVKAMRLCDICVRWFKHASSVTEYRFLLN
jgi:hypothetical protein